MSGFRPDSKEGKAYVPYKRHGLGLATISLSLACDDYDRVRPLTDGSVSPDAIDLACIRSSPADTFYRIFRYDEFDASEMSLSSLTMVVSRGEARWKAIPVFPMRFFFPCWGVYHIDSGIRDPQDLKGKKVGIPEYQMTAGLWIRGIYQHEYAVRPEDMEWYEERIEDRIPYKLPQGVVLRKIPPDKSLGSMMINREIDASLVYLGHKTLVDRSDLDLDKNPKVRRFFPDRRRTLADYYRRTGVLPVNHVIVIKNSVLEKHPWVALSLYRAFEEAKRVCYERLKGQTKTPSSVVGLETILQEQEEMFRGDPFPYGFSANKKTLETITQYSYEQGLSVRKVEPAELFADQALDL